MKSIIKKICKWLAVIFVGLVAADISLLAFFSLYHPKIQKADAAIILGAAINTPALYNRSLTGMKLYQQGKTDILILSGGRIAEEDISEAEYMRKVIRKNGGASVPMLLEDKSRTTYENINYSKKIRPEVKSVIIVSDRFHLARASLMALRNGYRPVYWQSPSGTYYKRSEWLYYYLREGIAILAYLPKFVFN